MENAFIHKLNRLLWSGIVIAVVSLAVYVSAGRYLMSNVSRFGDDILLQLNARLPVAVSARSVRGDWHGFTPELVLGGITLDGGDGKPLVLGEGRLALDVWRSLRRGTVHLQKVTLGDLTLHARLTKEGRFELPGFGSDGGDTSQWLTEFLLEATRVELRDNQLLLELPNGDQRQFSLDMGLDRSGSQRRAHARLVAGATGTTVELIARGVGNPLRPEQLNGRAWLSAQVQDLEALQHVFSSDMLPFTLDGGVALELWLDWEQGQSSLLGDLSLHDVLLVPQDEGLGTLRVDRGRAELALEGGADDWRLFVDDLRLSRGDSHAALDRASVSLRGDSLDLQLTGVDISPWVEQLLDSSVLPHKAAEVLKALDPQGRLDSLALYSSDVNTPLEDWRVQARLSQLALESFRGSPGVRNGAGYAELNPARGRVVLDSDRFGMFFPTVYRAPLQLDNVHGTLHVDWDEEAVVLSTSVLTAEAEAGTANALFGLNIPLKPSEVGLEMDLAIGISDTDARYRDQFIPQTLDSGLRDWLDDAVLHGAIREGAFIWRGSLRPQAGRTRTVQLFFDVYDTAVRYHADWPLVEDFAGLLLVDDAEVSVWAEQARLYDSVVSYLSAETWMADDGLQLGLAAEANGEADDALSVVNHSPLSALAGNAFAQWQASGPLRTRLDLAMNLADVSRVDVDVQSDWEGVTLQLQPANLTLTDIEGALAYHTGEGFSSRNLTGAMWGQPLQAQVSQQPAPVFPGTAFGTSPDPAREMVQVDIDTRIDASDLRNWLDLDLIGLAEGVAPVSAQILVPPDHTSALLLQADLLDVDLDLPEPWGKRTGDRGRLSLGVPLAGDDRVLALDLNEQLYLSLGLAGEGISGAALGLGRVPVAVPQGYLSISGYTPLLEDQALLGFFGRHIAGDAASSEAENAWLPLRVEELEVGRLRVLGEQVDRVVLSATQGVEEWQLAVRADWLRGSGTLAADLSQTDLQLDYLDLAGLDGLSFEALSQPHAGEAWQLPDFKVAVDTLVDGEQDIGALSFVTATEGQTLYFRDIKADLFEMLLGDPQPAQLSWRRDSEGSASAFSGVLEFEDFGAVLGSLGYQKVLETSGGSFTLDLSWPGAPTDVGLAAMEGDFDIAVGEGRFTETSAAAQGTLRVISILNLAHVVSQLSLDISDMFTSGIPFDTFTGQVNLGGGVIDVESLDVRGRSSRFQLSGLGTVADQSVNGEMVVTLPVANNLPWIAALAGGLPVAAGVFVVSKVFENQMNTLSSAVYGLSGSWSDPVVKFDSIFGSPKQREESPIAVNTEVSAAAEAVDPIEPAADEPAD